MTWYENNKAEFIKLYPNTENIKLAIKYKQTVRSVVYAAFMLRVKKSAEFIQNARGYSSGYQKLQSDKQHICWNCKRATNPEGYRCTWAERFKLPAGAKTLHYEFTDKNGVKMTREFITDCKDFLWG